MTTIAVEVSTQTAEPVPTCPLCGTVLDPLWDDLLCPLCQLDEAEKLADYDAELQQAWHPY
jgi:Zn finger protein HypA/HybF involved in hydrogenase expression